MLLCRKDCYFPKSAHWVELNNLNEGRKMNVNAYDSEFHALQSLGIQFLLP